MMDFQGLIIAKTEKIEVGKNSTPKMGIVIEEIKDKYPNSIIVDWIGDDKVALVEKLEIGSEVAITYNSKASEYNGRYYQNNNGWKLEVLSEPEIEEDKSLPF